MSQLSSSVRTEIDPTLADQHALSPRYRPFSHDGIQYDAVS
jgi:hypothetical protein